MISKITAPHFKASYMNIFLGGAIQWPFEKMKLDPNKHVILEEGQEFSSSRLGSASKPSPEKGTSVECRCGCWRGCRHVLRGGLLWPGEGSPVAGTAEGPCCVMAAGPRLGVPGELRGSCRAAGPACVCLGGVALDSQRAARGPRALLCWDDDVFPVLL